MKTNETLFYIVTLHGLALRDARGNHIGWFNTEKELIEWWPGSLERVVRARCEHCEQERVPQYDVELRLAGEEIAKWKDIARRLYLARGCKKREHLRIYAEAAYLKAQ